MKTITLTGLTLAFVALIGCATNPEPEPEAATPYADILTGSHVWPELTVGRIVVAQDAADRWEKQNRETKSKLASLVSLSNTSLDLDEAIQFVRDETDANIVVNWLALELVGIDQDSIVSVQLKKVPAAQLLEVVLDQISADAFDDDKAGYTIDQGLVKISTLRDLKSATETRVYDVRPLLYQTERLQAALYREHERADKLIRLLNQDTWVQLDRPPAFDLNKALSGTNSGGSTHQKQGGGEGGLFGQDAEKQNEKQPEECILIEERIDTLISVIQTTVADPDEWVEETHRITELNGNLIINTTADDHEEITALLDAIHKLQTQHFKARARSIEVFLLLQDAEAYRLKQQYRPALNKIEQALRVDPNRAEAKALLTIITETTSR